MQPKKSANPSQSAKKKISRKKIKKGEGFVRTHQIGFLVTPEEYDQIRRNCKKYHTGNLSDWVRMRAIEPCLDISVDMDNNS
jgi:hypothetical protein